MPDRIPMHDHADAPASLGTTRNRSRFEADHAGAPVDGERGSAGEVGGRTPRHAGGRNGHGEAPAVFDAVTGERLGSPSQGLRCAFDLAVKLARRPMARAWLLGGVWRVAPAGAVGFRLVVLR